MPSNIVKKYSKETGKSTKEVERLWKKASQIARDMGQVEDYDYIVGILQNMLGIDESSTRNLIKTFLWEQFKKSDKKDFSSFYETMISGSFSVTPEIINPKCDSEEDEENCEIE